MQNNTDTDLNNLHQADDKNQELEKEKAVDEAWQKTNTEKQANDTNAAETNVKVELDDIKTKYAELEDQYKRLWADQQNMINRFNRERVDIHKYAAASTLEAILPALDNFDFAKKSLNENTDFAQIMQSINMLQEQLLMSLKSVGLEEVDTNNGFNPQYHEAVSSIKDTEKAEGSIIEVLKKGFKVKDKVLRVATVIVSTKA